MPMQLRSRNLPSDSAEGRVEMDAPRSTSTVAGEIVDYAVDVEDMGHSAKSHSSVPQAADESGPRPSTDGVKSSNDGGIGDAINSGQHAFSHVVDDDNTGFQSPKKTSRAPSVRSESPVDDGKMFFKDWFLKDKSGKARPLFNWADSNDDDGPGDLPEDWIKQESQSIALSWSPPSDSNDIDFSFDNILREAASRMSKEEKARVVRRHEKLKKTGRMKKPSSVSETTNESKSAQHATGSLRRSQPSPAASTPRIPAAEKGKGRKMQYTPSIRVDDDEYVSEDEKLADQYRLQQILADAALAKKLQAQLAAEQGVGDVPPRPVAPLQGTSKWTGRLQTESDHISERRRSAGLKSGNSKARPTPLEQIPKSSLLFKRPVTTQPDPSDDSSESSSSSSSSSRDSLPSYMKPPKNKKRKSKKKNRKSSKRAKHLPPSPSGSPSSSSSSDSDSTSDWSSLGNPPSDNDSDDSKQTRRAKKRAKYRWNLKMMRLKFEQSNAKPEPPPKYNGEADFAKMEAWTHIIREWCKESYIRPNMREYRTELESLRDSVGDIPTRALIVQFWDGANYEMRHRWANDGYDPETSSLNELEAAALNYEHAIKVSNAQKRQDERGGKSTEQNPREKQNRRGRGPRTEGASNQTQSTANDSKEKSENSKPTTDSKQKTQGRKKSHNLTKEQMAEYRAQGKCFTCGEKEHLSKDCPKNNELKPKGGMTAATISFAEVDRLQGLREAVDFGVFSMKIEPVQFTAEHLRAIDDVLVAKMYADLRQAVPFVFDYFDDDEDSPFDLDRFNITPTQHGWLIWDHHNNDDHEVLRTDLLNPDFDLIDFLVSQKWKIQDLLCTANHRHRVDRRKDIRDKFCENAESRTPLRLRTPPPAHPTMELLAESEPELSDCARYFVHKMLRQIPEDVPIDSLHVLRYLTNQFLEAVPYSFYVPDGDTLQEMYSQERFTLRLSEEDFLFVQDHYYGETHTLDYLEVLWRNWSPRAFLEAHHVAREDWWKALQDWEQGLAEPEIPWYIDTTPVAEADDEAAGSGNEADIEGWNEGWSSDGSLEDSDEPHTADATIEAEGESGSEWILDDMPELDNSESAVDGLDLSTDSPAEDEDYLDMPELADASDSEFDSEEEFVGGIFEWPDVSSFEGLHMRWS
ncbi:hypothetical protein R3P38DRAFT_3364494 [Favolaschia claudopus]|uniref:CCHC-type domain-containing protein n=1 Tax=Favolaschia claudopus TaxID=2862362 RepID=A0AAW0AI47_9AGAR